MINQLKWPRGPRILVIDDESAVVNLIERILRSSGFHRLASSVDPRLAESLARTSEPDLVILDLNMPGVNGLDVLETLRNSGPVDDSVPVLILTGDLCSESRNRALESGANDFLTKPFDSSELILRIRNLLHTRLLHLSVLEKNKALEEALVLRECQIDETRLEVIERLALAAELRDYETGRHMRSVGEISAQIALQLGVDEQTVEVIRRAAPLHDIGKIGIPDMTLLKPGGLTPAEREIMCGHTLIGARILEGGDSILLQTAAVVARHHHERWDGTGYPHMLAGRAIPLAARIVAVADVYDALCHDRPYRQAFPEGEAIRMIVEGRSSQFDPDVVDAFLAVAGICQSAAA